MRRGSSLERKVWKHLQLQLFEHAVHVSLQMKEHAAKTQHGGGGTDTDQGLCRLRSSEEIFTDGKAARTQQPTDHNKQMWIWWCIQPFPYEWTFGDFSCYMTQTWSLLHACLWWIFFKTSRRSLTLLPHSNVRQKFYQGCRNKKRGKGHNQNLSYFQSTLKFEDNLGILYMCELKINVLDVVSDEIDFNCCKVSLSII